MNSTKSATSMVYAGCVDGSLLLPYVVYKATNMCDTRTLGDPQGAKYNRSKSGWFDLRCFEEWFMSVALPYLKPLRGKKVLVGNNLSSHLSAEIIQKCEENQIAFCFLPSHSALKRLDSSKQCHCLQLAECIAGLIHLFYFTNSFLMKR